MSIYRVHNINYDLDPEDRDLMPELPFDLIFQVSKKDFDPAEELADMVSHETGQCVLNCDWQVIPQDISEGEEVQ